MHGRLRDNLQRGGTGRGQVASRERTQGLLSTKAATPTPNADGLSGNWLLTVCFVQPPMTLCCHHPAAYKFYWRLAVLPRDHCPHKIVFPPLQPCPALPTHSHLICVIVHHCDAHVSLEVVLQVVPVWLLALDVNALR